MRNRTCFRVAASLWTGRRICDAPRQLWGRVGALFLFYGLYRETLLLNGQLRYSRRAPNVHVLWGWLSVGETEIVKGFDTSVSENPVSNYAAASSVDGRLIQTSPGSFLQTG